MSEKKKAMRIVDIRAESEVRQVNKQSREKQKLYPGAIFSDWSIHTPCALNVSVFVPTALKVKQSLESLQGSSGLYYSDIFSLF